MVTHVTCIVQKQVVLSNNPENSNFIEINTRFFFVILNILAV